MVFEWTSSSATPPDVTSALRNPPVPETLIGQRVSDAPILHLLSLGKLGQPSRRIDVSEFEQRERQPPRHALREHRIDLPFAIPADFLTQAPQAFLIRLLRREVGDQHQGRSHEPSVRWLG